MDIGIAAGAGDPESTVARCRRLGLKRVALHASSLRDGGTDWPDPVRLRETVARFGDAGIDVPTLITWFGSDPSVILDPAGNRRRIDAMRRTILSAGRAGIRSLLHYIDLPEPPDPADDPASWAGLIAVLRELVAEAENADVRIANHGIWRCLPDTLRESAAKSGVRASGYRRYREAGWGGPYLVRDADGIRRLLDAVPSPHNGVAFCTE